MEASIVWDVWRRILREPALGSAIFEPDFVDRAAEYGFTPDQVPVVLAYATTPHRTRWFITNYRFRLVSSFVHAVETGTPMTARLLVNSGRDLRELGERYAEASGWKDYGPFVYGFCADVLSYLARSELAQEVPYVRDIIALEATSVELVSRLASLPPERWRLPTSGRDAASPTSGRDAASPTSGRDERMALSSSTLRRTPQGATVTVEHVLVPWLRDKSLLGRTSLEKGPQHFLVYVPTPTSAYKLAGIPERGAQLFNALSEPQTLAALRLALGGELPPEQDDVAIVQRLCDYGVIEAVRE